MSGLRGHPLAFTSMRHFLTLMRFSWGEILVNAYHVFSQSKQKKNFDHNYQYVDDRIFYNVCGPKDIYVIYLHIYTYTYICVCVMIYKKNDDVQIFLVCNIKNKGLFFSHSQRGVVCPLDNAFLRVWYQLRRSTLFGVEREAMSIIPRFLIS